MHSFVLSALRALSVSAIASFAATSFVSSHAAAMQSAGCVAGANHIDASTVSVFTAFGIADAGGPLVTVDATGMAQTTLGTVGANAILVADDGIFGTFTVTSAIYNGTNPTVLPARLEGILSKTCESATVTVNAAGFSAAAVAVVDQYIAKVDTITNLPAGSTLTLTAAEANGKFISGAGSVAISSDELTGTSDLTGITTAGLTFPTSTPFLSIASGGLLAAYPERVSGYTIRGTGTVSLVGTVDFDVNVTAISASVSVDADGVAGTSVAATKTFTLTSAQANLKSIAGAGTTSISGNIGANADFTAISSALDIPGTVSSGATLTLTAAQGNGRSLAGAGSITIASAALASNTDFRSLTTAGFAFDGSVGTGATLSINAVQSGGCVVSGAGTVDILCTAGADSVGGNIDANVIASGLAGADTLASGDGADSISGGDDNDTITAGAGDDSIVGGNGSDTADFVVGLASATFGAPGTTFTLSSAADGNDTITGVEILVFADVTVYVVGSGGAYESLNAALAAAPAGSHFFGTLSIDSTTPFTDTASLNAILARCVGGSTYSVNVLGMNAAQLAAIAANTATLGAITYPPVKVVSGGAPSGYFTTIQAGINFATAGDIVNVAAGTYAENLTIAKALDVRGPNYGVSPNGGSRAAEAIVVPATSDPANLNVVSVTASGVSFRGFTVDGDNTALAAAGATDPAFPTATLDASRGVFCSFNGLSNTLVEKNIVRNVVNGAIRLQQATNQFPTNSVASGTFANDNLVNDNLCQNCNIGVDIRQSGFAGVTNNTVSNSRYGIYFGDCRIENRSASAYKVISGNTLAVRQWGIWFNLYRATPYAVSNNTITAVAEASRTEWFGVMLANVAMLQNFTNQNLLPLVATPEWFTFTNNTIDGSGVGAATTAYGYWGWALDNGRDTAGTDHFTQITGGSVSNVAYGISLRNVANAGTGSGVDSAFGTANTGAHAAVSGVAFSPKAGGTGFFMLDSSAWIPSNPAPLVNKRNVQLAIGAGNSISGGATGISVTQPSSFIQADYNPIVGGTVSDLALSGQSGDYILLAMNKAIDATSASFGGSTGAAATDAANFAVANKITDKLDSSALGRVTVKANNLFVTSANSVAAGIALVSAGETVNVQAGAYTDAVVTVNAENLTVNSEAGVSGYSFLLGSAANLSLAGAGDVNADGSAAANILAGSAGINAINGLAGADTISGGDSADALNGGNDNDSVSGNGGDDAVSGGNGDDTLSGNDGVDTVNGDAGNDSLDGGAGNDSLDGGAGIDSASYGISYVGALSGSASLSIDGDTVQNVENIVFSDATVAIVGRGGSSYSVLNDALAASGSTKLWGDLAFSSTTLGFTDTASLNAILARVVDGSTLTVNVLGMNKAQLAAVAANAASFPTLVYPPVQVVNAGEPSGYFNAIQAAINFATAGDVVNVAAGTYAEDLIVAKALSLRGPNYGINPNTGTRVAEAIIVPASNNHGGPGATAGKLIQVLANDISVDGFILDGDNPAISGGFAYGDVDSNCARALHNQDSAGTSIHVSGIDMSHNIVRNFTTTGYYLLKNGTLPNSSGNYVRNNLFQKMRFRAVYAQGEYDVSITGNVMDQVHVGVAISSVGTTAATGFQPRISNNTINLTTFGGTSRHMGISVNHRFGTSVRMLVENNTITADASLVNIGEGLRITTMVFGGSTHATGNIVNCGGTLTTGLWLWNNDGQGETLVSGGSITNAKTNGVYLTDRDTAFADPYSYSTGNYGTISGTAISTIAGGTSVNVHWNGLGSNLGPCVLTLQDNTVVSGDGIGMAMNGAKARVNFSGTSPASFDGALPAYITLSNAGATNPATSIDATTVAFNGGTGADATDTANFAIASKITDKLDSSALGRVTVKANNLFVNSTNSVAAGLALVSAGETVNVQAGAYTDGAVTVNAENLTVNSEAGVSGYSFLLGSAANLSLAGAGDVNADGSAAANILAGSAGINAINGLAGADTISGGDSADTLNGGDGNDSLDGGAGNDSLDGGAGIDGASYGISYVGALSGSASLSIDGDTVQNVENIVFSDATVAIVGRGGSSYSVLNDALAASGSTRLWGDLAFSSTTLGFTDTASLNAILARVVDGSTLTVNVLGMNKAQLAAVAANAASFPTLVYPPVQVVNAGEPSGYFNLIQAAIDFATAGDTVNVAAGTYAEALTVSKSLTVRGPNAGKAGTDATRGAEAVIMAPAGMTASYGDTAYIVTVPAGVSGVVFDGLMVNGDNPATTSPFTANGANPDADEGFSITGDGAIVRNCVIKNLFQFGVTMGATGGVDARFGEVTDNLIENVPYWAAVLAYDDYYAAIEGNTIVNAWRGVQTNNHYKAVPAGKTATISDNAITTGVQAIDGDTTYADYDGILHNLQYGVAAWTIANNTVTSTSASNTNADSDGIEVWSIQTGATVSITGNAIAGFPNGYTLWNCPATAGVAVSGGSVSGAINGVVATNRDNYGDAQSSVYTISGVSISASANGVLVDDNAANLNGSTVALSLSGGTVTGGATGLRVSGTDASVPSLSATAFSGQSGDYIALVGNAGAIDATTASFGGSTGATATLAQNYDIEDKISHKLDDSSLGLVRVKASNVFVSAAGNIGRGVTAASTGDTVNVEAGSYTENITVTKRITLDGAGSGETGTVLSSSTTATPVISVTGSGLDAANQLVIKDVRVTGAANASGSDGIAIYGDTPVSFVTVDGVHVTGHGQGVHYRTGTISNATVSNSTFHANNFGVRVATAVASMDGMTIDGCTMTEQTSSAISTNPSGSQTVVNTNFTVSDSTFTNNSRAGVASQHDLSFFGFRGNATLSNVTVTSGNGASANSNSYGIVFTNGSGRAALGTVSLSNVTVQGHVGKGALTFQLYNELSGVSMSGVNLRNCVAPWGDLIVDSTDADAMSAGDTALKSVVLWNTGGVNATGASFFAPGAATAYDRAVLADNFSISNAVGDVVDAPGLGLVRTTAGKIYVSAASAAGAIYRAIGAASAGDEIVVQDGTALVLTTEITASVTISGNFAITAANIPTDATATAVLSSFTSRLAAGSTLAVDLAGMNASQIAAVNANLAYFTAMTGNPVTISRAGATVGFAPTVQAGIDFATAGDTVNVAAGTYAQNITIAKALDVRGPNFEVSPNGGARVAEAILVPASTNTSSGAVVTITSSGVSFRGFTVDGDNAALAASGVGLGGALGTSIDAARCVFVQGNGLNGVTVSKNIAKNTVNGLRIEQTTNYFATTAGALRSTNIVLDDNLVQDTTGTGIRLGNSMYAKVTNNTVTNADNGIAFSSFRISDAGLAADRVIQGNTISARYAGIWVNLFHASPYALVNNTITVAPAATSMAPTPQNRTAWYGIMYSTVSAPQNFTNQVSMPLVATPEWWTATNNTIDGVALESTSVGHGYWLYYVDNNRDTAGNDHFGQISGGSVSNVAYGIMLKNKDTDPATNFGNSAIGAHAAVSGVAFNLNAGGTGFRLIDDAAWVTGNPAPLVNKRNVQLAIGAGNSISGGATGISVTQPFSFAQADYNPIVGGTVSDLALSGQSGDYILLAMNKAIDATSASFGGSTGAAATDAANFAVANKITDKLDSSALGRVTVKANNLFVTSANSVAAGIALVSAGETVNVQAGAYTDAVVTVNAENLTVNSEAGVSGYSFLLGSAANLSLAGAGDVNADGSAAANILAGSAGINAINGLAGADTISGGDSADALNGGNDNDSVSGNGGDDAVSGGNGDDTLSGNDGVDTVNGDAGNDSLDGGAGNDSLDGGAGIDSASYGISYVGALSGSASLSIDGDTVQNVENIVFSDATVAIVGRGGSSYSVLNDALAASGSTKLWGDLAFSSTTLGFTDTASLNAILARVVGGSTVSVSYAGMSADQIAAVNANLASFNGGFSNNPVTIVRAATTVGYAPTIQSGIDFATAGDILNVAAGTYEELLWITKGVTLRGPNASVAGNGTRGAEAIVQFPASAANGEVLVYGDADGITLEGLNLRLQDSRITAAGSYGYLWFSYGLNNLAIRNNRMYGGEIPIYIYPNSASKTGLLIEDNFIDGGPFVNSSFSRAMYIGNTAGTIQDNVIVNASTGIQYMPYSNAATGTIRNNSVAAAGVGLYHNVQRVGAGAVSWENNTVTVAPNDRAGLKALVDGAYSAAITFRGIEVRTFGNEGTGSAPTVAFTGNSVDASVGATGYNSTVRDAVRFTAPYGVGSATFSGNSFENWTVGVNDAYGASFEMSCNWWGTADANALAAAIPGTLRFSPFRTASTGTDCADGAVVISGKGRSYSTIQAGHDASATVAGDTLTVAAGSYTENITVTKRITLDGAGSGETGTVLSSSTTATPVISVTGSGLDAANQLVIKDVRVTGAANASGSDGIAIYGDTPVSFITVDGVYVTGHGQGVHYRTGTISNATVSNSTFHANNFGVRVATAVASMDGMTIDGCTMTEQTSSAISTNPSGSQTVVNTNFTVSDSTFTNNSRAGVASQHDLSFFGFRGNATLSNVTVTSGNGASANSNSYGIVFTNGSGRAALGTVSLSNVTVQGHVGKGALTFQLYNELSGVSMSGVNLRNCVAPWGDLIVDSTDADAMSAGDTALKSVVLWNTGGVNATGASFFAPGAATAYDRAVLADNFSISNAVGDVVDFAGLGLVRTTAGKIYVSAASAAGAIYRAIGAASAGDEIIVQDGTALVLTTEITASVTITGNFAITAANIPTDATATAVLSSFMSRLAAGSTVSADMLGMNADQIAAVNANLAGFAAFSNNPVGLVRGGGTVAYYTTIQAGINAATTGDTVTVAAGTYAENLSLSKLITLQGAGSGETGATVVSSVASLTPVIDVTVGGTVANRVIVKDMRLTGGFGGANDNRASGIQVITGPATERSHYTFDNLTIVDNQGHGIVFNSSALTSVTDDIVVTNCRFIRNSSGFRTGSLGTVTNLSVTDSTFTDNTVFGLTLNTSSAGAASFFGDNVTIEDCAFNGNGTASFGQSGTGYGDLALLGFQGDATIRNVTITGRDAATAAHRGLQLRGQTPLSAAGNIVIDDVTITGAYRVPGAAAAVPGTHGLAMIIRNFSDASGISLNNLVINNTVAGNGLVLESVGGGLNLANTTFGVPSSTQHAANDIAYSVVNAGTGAVNATGATFAGLDRAVAADNFSIGRRVYDIVDAAGLGLVRTTAANVFVHSGGSVARGVGAASADDTVRIEAGAYTDGAVTVNTTGLTIDSDAGVSGYSFTLGTADALVLAGGGDVNVLGNTNANSVTTSDGANSIDGDAGIDTAVFAAAAPSSLVAGSSISVGSDTVTRFEKLVFSDQTIVLVGTGGSEYLTLNAALAATTTEKLFGALAINSSTFATAAELDAITARFVSGSTVSVDVLGMNATQLSAVAGNATASGVVVYPPVQVARGASIEGYFSTIQAGIDFSVAGDTVNVAAGTYTEQFAITKAVTVQGPNAAVAGNGTRGAEAVLDYSAASVGSGQHILVNAGSLKGFKIQDNNVPTVAEVRIAVRVAASGAAGVENNLFFRDSGFNGPAGSAQRSSDPRAIHVDQTTGGSVTIASNYFTGAATGVFGNQSWFRGVWTQGVASAVAVSNNLFDQVRSAMNIQDDMSMLTIGGNAFNGSGVTVMSFGFSGIPGYTDASTVSTSFTLGANTFANSGTLFNLTSVPAGFRLDATASTFNGTAFSAMDRTGHMEIAARSVQNITNSAKNGLVVSKAGNLYVPGFGAALTGGVSRAITLASDGETVNVDAGTFPGNLAVNKRIALVGAGASTVISSNTASTPVITVSASGSSATDRLVVSNLTATGGTGGSNSGSGIYVSGAGAISNLTFDGVTVTGNTGFGIAFNNTFATSDVKILNSTVTTNTDAGIRVASATPSFTDLLVDGCTVSSNGTFGFVSNPSQTNTNVNTRFTIQNSTFSGNNTLLGANNHDMFFGSFRGDATISNVDITANQRAHGIVFNGWGNATVADWQPAGNIVLNDVVFNGTIDKTCLYMYRYSTLAGVTMTDVDMSAVTTLPAWYQLTSDSNGTLNAGNTKLRTISSGGSAVDATNVVFYDSVGLVDKSSLANLYRIEDAIRHKVDFAVMGFVRVNAASVYLSKNSGTLENAILAATDGDVVYVEDGTAWTLVNEITKSITFSGNFTVTAANIPSGSTASAVLSSFVTRGASGATFSAVTTGMSADQLNAVGNSYASFNGGVTGDLTLTSAQSAAQISAILAGAADGSAYVVATGMGDDQLNAVAAAATKVATDGITGTMVVTSGIVDANLGALLGKASETGAVVEVNASGMTDGELSTVVLAGARVDEAYNLSLDNGQSAGEITALLGKSVAAASTGKAMAVADATTMDATKLNALGGSASKLAADGITGSVALNSGVTDANFTALFGKIALIADVRVDGTSLGASTITIVSANILKVDTAFALFLTNAQTATELGNVLGVSDAASATANATGMDSAAGGKLSKLADNYTKFPLNGISGTFTISAGLTPTQITNLLSRVDLGTSGSSFLPPASITIDATGMDNGQLSSIAAAVAGAGTPANQNSVFDIVNLSLTSAQNSSEIATLLNVTNAGEATVNATGMDATQLGAVADASNAVDQITGTIEITAALTAAQIQAIIGNASTTSANVVVNTDGMSPEQQGAIYTTGVLAVELSGSVATGDLIVANVDVSGISQPVVGAQLRVLYDATRLEFVEDYTGENGVPDGFGDGVGGTDFTQTVYVTAGTGMVSFATGVDIAGAGTGLTSGNVAQLRFRALVPFCDTSDLVSIAATGFQNLLTTDAATTVPFLAVGSSLVSSLDNLQLAGVPASDTTVPADAGTTAGAAVAAPTVTASNNCEPSVPVVLSIAYPGGATGSTWPARFPVGVSIATWTATDSGGNIATATRVYTVENYQLATIDVNLVGSVNASIVFNQDIRLRLSSGAVVVATVPFTGNNGAVIDAQIPVRDDYTCVTAKDAGHTLAVARSLTVSGTKYVASGAFALRAGDSNDDNQVDILDFGVFVSDRGTGKNPASRSNFNRDANVNNGDFGFIGLNFLQVGDSCAGGFFEGGEPLARISVKELRRRGLGELEQADINMDGWLDETDVALAMQGHYRRDYQNNLDPADEIELPNW